MQFSSWLASFFSRPNAAQSHRTTKALALEKNANPSSPPTFLPFWKPQTLQAKST